MTPPTEAPASRGNRGSRNASFVTAGILLSRVAGLVRERALAHYFGASLQMDAWRAALRLPNVLQNLLGEGTLSASFIPLYAAMEEQGRKEDARRFAGAVLGLLVAVAGGLALLGTLLAPAIVAILFFGFEAEQQARTTTLVRILFPMTALLVLSAWTLGILNTHRRFLLSYTAPVFWNLAIVGALLGGGIYLELEGDALLRLVAWGALAGGALQFGVQLPGALRLLGGLRPSLSLQVPGVRTAIRNFLPVAGARGVVNLSGWLDYALAALLAAGALSALGFAQVLYMLPISLFGMAVAAGELPELARRRSRGSGAGAGAGDLDGHLELDPDTRAELNRMVGAGMERVAFFLVPATLLYLAVGDVIVATLFQTGAFGPDEVRLTWAVLAAYAVGMGASASSRVLSSTFYALGNTRTPARIALLRVGVALAAGAALMFPLDTLDVGGGLRYGAVGLALGSALGARLELALLRRHLTAVMGAAGPRPGRMPRLVGAALAAAGTGVGLRWAVDTQLGGVHPVLTGALVLAPSGLVYLGVVRGLGVPLPGMAFLRRSKVKPPEEAGS